MAANPSDALILWDPHSNHALAKTDETSRPGGGRWAIILKALSSPSPGRTLDRVYTSLGSVLEKQANRAAYNLGVGPHAVAQKIQAYFGDCEQRVERLEDLRTSLPPKLEKQCLKLVKYTMPTESANTQFQAFKDIVNHVTLFPGLRSLLLSAKYLENATSIDAVIALWERPAGSPDQEWRFWQTLAATCLTDAMISALVECSSISDLCNCREDELSVIERLSIVHESSGASPYSRALCIRYLSGILHLPGFWLHMGTAHSHVLKKLCLEMVRVLKDIGVDILALGPIGELEPPFDYDGVDLLVTTVLTGISSWLGRLGQEIWSLQPWYENLTEILNLLRRPRAAELLPHSSACATSVFEHILPTASQYVELNVFVDGNEETPDNPHGIFEEAVANLPPENNSTTSVHSTLLDQDDGRSVGSLEDNGEIQSQDSDQDSLQEPSQNEADNLSTSDEESPIETSSEDNGAVQSQYSDKGSLPGPIQNEADNSSISDEERITETQMDGGNRAAQTQDSDKAGPSLNKADNSSTSDEESPTDTRLQYSSMHPASLVDPATHAPALMQLLDIKLDRHVIDYVVDCVSETVDYAMGRSSSLTFRTHHPPPPSLSLSSTSTAPAPHLSIALEEWALERVFLGALIVASKYTDNSSLKNVDWALCTGLFGKRDVGRMEREFLDVLDWELGVQEADLLAHHEGLVGAQERAFIASRAPLLTTRVKTPTKTTTGRIHSRKTSVPELEPSSPQSSLASMDVDPVPAPPKLSNGNKFHDLLRAFPLPQPRHAHAHGAPIRVNA
ncbi:Cyclin N-terminal domain-containing protein [Mycena venus]|uniref:Cyclin N-terminal domain-containing protein n=1 Tax=Mycena venus TaxID=2733690 RepID=A0A8H6XC47_9AGAR|nr:Cyclin N-terminal domain-containing protein [Mycena venus]